jgi:hypothetical protein
MHSPLPNRGRPKLPSSLQRTARERTKSGTALHPGNVINLAHHRAQRRPAAARCTSLRVDIDADGRLHHECCIRSEHADHLTDVLLLLLLRAREARQGGGAK